MVLGRILLRVSRLGPSRASTFGPYRIQRKDLKTIRLALYDRYLQLVLHACVPAGQGREETQHMNHFGLAKHRPPSSVSNRKPHDDKDYLTLCLRPAGIPLDRRIIRYKCGGDKPAMTQYCKPSLDIVSI